MLSNRSSLATARGCKPESHYGRTDGPVGCKPESHYGRTDGPVGAVPLRLILCRRVASVSRWAERPRPARRCTPPPPCVRACRYCFAQSRNVQPDRTGPKLANCVDRRAHSLVGCRRSDRRAWHGCAVDKQCAAFDGPCGMKYSASPRQVEPRATSAPGRGLTRGTSAPGLDPRTCTRTGRGPGLPLLHLRPWRCSSAALCTCAPRCRMAQSCTSVHDCSPI